MCMHMSTCMYTNIVDKLQIIYVIANICFTEEKFLLTSLICYCSHIKLKKRGKKYSNILNCFIICKIGWNRLEKEIENQERNPL